MSKTIKALVQNNAGEVTETINVVQGAGDKGKPARMKAVRGARYQLEDPTAGNTGPDSVRTKRVSKNLHVMLEGSTEPDLIVENYYSDGVIADASGGLYGRAEDGNLYEYIPEDPNVANLPVALADGGVPVSQVLGGGAVASTFQLAALPLLAVGGGALTGGGLLAAAGVLGATALATGGGGGGTTATSPILSTGPDLLASADTGKSNTDNITSNTKPGFNVGVVPAGSTAQLVVDGVVVPSQATLAADGSTVLTPTTALSEGKHTLAYNYKNAQNEVSGNSPGTDVTIDTLPPAAPAAGTAAEMADGVINASEAADGTVIAVPLTGTGAAEGDSITVTIDGVDTTYVLTAADITANKANVTVPKTAIDAAGQGAATVTSFLTDVAGNKSPVSAALTLNIDTTPPTAPGMAVVPENSGGGVNAAEAADGVVVNISIAGSGAVAGDVLTVYVNGEPTLYTLTPADLVSGVASVTVPKAVIDKVGQGQAAVTSTLTDAAHNVSSVSPVRNIIIDTVAPNPPGAPVVPENAGGGINIAEAADGTLVEVSLAGTGALVGDKLTVIIDGTPTVYTLLAADITAGKATVPVPKSVLDAAGPGAASVTATITDAAGNVSLPSAATPINIQSALPSAPAAPVVPEAAGGGLNAAEAADGTPVEVSLAGTGAGVGDTVNVIVDGVSTPHTLTQAEVDAGKAIVQVPKAVIDAAGQGPAEVTTTVSVGGNVSPASPPTVINIDTVAPNAPAAPVVAENAGGGVNAAEAADGIVVEVSLGGTNAVAGDIVNVIVDGVSTPHVLTQAEVDAGKANVTVPKSVLDNPAVGQGSAAVTATITDGAGNTSLPSPVTTINIDTVAPNAPAAPVVAENAGGGVNAAEAADGIVVEVSLGGTNAVAGDIVNVIVDGVSTPHTLTQAEVDAGKANVTVPKSVLDNPAVGQGSATVTATITDGAGNTSQPSPVTTINIDTVAPNAPAAPVVAENAGAGVNAAEAADGIVVEVSLAGTNAVPGDIVNVIVDGVSTPHVLTQAEVDAGKANVTVPKSVLDNPAVGQGDATVIATITDIAGNTSLPSPATTITIDTVAPNAPAAPVVAENTNGGINAAEAADGTVVEVSLAGTNAQAGDKVTVMIDGAPTVYTLLPADITAGKAMVTVPKSVLEAAGQGPATVTATITDIAGNTSLPSPVTNITIDTLAPNAPAAPVVAENAGGGVNAAEAADGIVVEVSLAGTNAVAGDTVNVLIDGVGTPHVLTQAEVDAGKANVTVPKSVLDNPAVGQGDATVIATITDIAGNTSQPSPATTINIDTVAPNAPAAPVVAENAGGGVNAAEAADGIVVEVSLAGTNAVPGDIVNVIVDGVSTPHVLTQAEVDAGKASVTVPKSVLDNPAVGQGSATVTATITDIAGNTSTPSPATTINIDTQGGGVNASVIFTGLTIDVPTLAVGDSKDTGSSNADFITSDRTLTIQGTASGFSNFGAAASDKILVQILAPDGVTVVAEGTVVPDALGVFTFSNQGITLPDGKYTIKTSVVDGLGNLVKAGDTQALVIDGSGNSNPGNAPSTVDSNTGASFSGLSIHDTAMGSTDSGSSTTDFITNDNTLVIEGNVTGFTSTGGTAGDKVRVQIFAADGTTVVAQQYVTPDAANGNHFVFDNKAMSLADGKYTIKTAIVDAAGNLVKAGDTQALVIDTNENGTNPGSNPGNPNPVDPNASGAVSFSGLTINGLDSYDTGASDTDFITSDKTLMITGKVTGYSAAGGGIGDKVLVQIMAADGVTVVAQQYVTPDAANGNYFVFDNKAMSLADGKYTIKTSIVDAAGNPVKPGDSQALVIDTNNGGTTPGSNPGNENGQPNSAVDNNTGVTFSAFSITDAAKQSADTGVSQTDFITNDNTLVFKGTAAGFTTAGGAAGDRVLVQVLAADGVTVVAKQYVTPAGNGDFVFDNTGNTIADGNYTVKVAVVDAAGNVVKAGTTQPLTIDTSGNSNPGNENGQPNSAVDSNTGASFSGLSIHDTAMGSTDSGGSTTDFITNDNTLVIEGNVTGFTSTGGTAGDKVRVQIFAADGTTVVAQQYVTPDAANGNHFVFDNKAMSLADGKYTIKTAIVDAAGNLVKAGDTQALVIDTNENGTNPGSNPGNPNPVDPNASGAVSFSGLTINGLDSYDTGASDTDFITSDKTLLITGKVTGYSAAGGGIGDKVLVQIMAADGVTVVAQGFVTPDVFTGQYTFDNKAMSLADGKYTIKTSIVDAAGNPVKPGDSQALVIDTNNGGTTPGSNPGNENGQPNSAVDSNTGVTFSAFSITDAAKQSADTGVSQTDFITNDNTLVFKGTAAGFTTAGGAAGDRVLVQVLAADGVTVVAKQYVTPAGNGDFVFDNTGNTIADGNYTVKVAVVDAAGNVVKAGTTQPLTIDTSATINPGNANGVDTNTGASFTNLSINNPANGSNDDGASSTDFITSDSTLVIAGTVNGFSATGATAGDKVLVQILNSSNVVVAQQYVTPDASGNFAFDNKANTLADGNYTIKTSIVDVAGNTVKAGDSQPLVISASAGNSVSITGITTDSGVSNSDFITNDQTLVISGNVTGYVPASGNQVHVTILAANGTTVIVDQFVTPSASGVWNFDNSANTLAAGNYTVRAELVSASHASLGVVQNHALTIEIAATPDAALTFSGLTIHDVPNGSIDSGESSTDFITSDRTLMVEGKVANFNAAHVAAGDKVLVEIINSNNVVVAKQYVAPDANGNYVFDNRANSLADGDYTIKTSIVSLAGNLIKAGDTQVLTIDNIPPTNTATGPNSYVDNVGSIQSPNSTAATTDDTTPGLNIGTVPAGTTPKLYVDGVAVDAVYDPVAGSLTPTTPLTLAPHALAYTLTDKAGMESGLSPALNVTIVGGPVFSSGATASAVENIATTATVYDAQADGDTGVTYTLTGADATKFTINATTGVVKFVASPDFEAATDVGANNVYDITVRATNAAGAFTDKAVAVTVTNVNDAPVLSFGSTLNYNENSAATAINTAITVADQDNTTLTSATVSIASGYVAGQDVLSFTNVAGTMGNIAASVTGGVMTLTSAGGTATLAEWQAALRAVSYSNTSDIPNTAARTVTYVINDGALNSTTITSTLSVFAVNDAPVLAYSYVDSHVLTTSTVPTVTVTDSSPAATTNNATATFTLTFSEAIDASTLTAADITVTNGTFVSLTQVDATHWTVVAKAPVSGSGVMAVSVADASYKSLAGVDGLGSAATQVFGTGAPSPIITGSTAADTLIGSDLDDTITLNGGADKVFAGAGNDTVILNNSNIASLALPSNGMKIDGGAGINTLELALASNMLDLTNATVASKLGHFNTLNMNGTGSNFVMLSVDNVLTLAKGTADNSATVADESKMLVINGGQGDGVYLVNASDWTATPDGIWGDELELMYGLSYGFDPNVQYYELKLNGATLYINAYMASPGTPTLTPANAYNGGVTQAATIDSLFAAGFTDVETALATPQTFKGVAVTFAGTTADSVALGKYQYLNASNVWVDLPTGLTDSNALYLDHGTQIRFLAATGNSAMAKPDMQVRLIDSTLGATANGSFIDVQDNGGITPFSGQAMTLTDHVVAHITDNAASVAANGGVVTYTLTFSGAVDAATISQADIAVTHMSSTGTFSGGAVTNFMYDVALHQWTFNVAEPASGSGTTLISLQDGSYNSATGASGMGATVAQTYGTAGATDLTVNSLTLAATASGVEVDATQVATFEALQGVNTVDLTGGGINTLKLDLHAVMQMPSAADNAVTTSVNESHTVVVNGNGTGVLGASDVVELTSGASWSTSATHLTAANLTSAYGNDFAFTSGHQYAQYTNGAATLFVDEQLYVAKL